MQVHTAVFIVVIAVTHATGYLIKVPNKSITTPSIRGLDNTQWVHIQETLIPLFDNVCETSQNFNITKLAQEFTFQPADYTIPDVITNLENLVATGLLPRGIIFSEFNPDHLKELRIIYDVLYYAKDFNAFYKAAAWARQNMNCALYLSAIYMAIQYRLDTKKIAIPPPYELLPNYFINQEVVIQAAKILGDAYNDYFVPNESIRNEGDAYIIDCNYTAMFYDNDDESKLAYFREDVGLNSYYYLKRLKMAPWFNGEDSKSYGENMFHTMKQLMARYNLERYANGLPELDDINWEASINIPYDPMLVYSNGDEFGHRTSSVELAGNQNLVKIRAIEDNLLNIVEHLHQRGFTKIQILNHLMEILVTSESSYETLARRLLGKDVINNGVVSVLEHYMTSLRDPVFWQINAKIVKMIDDTLKILPTYERSELFFPGVEIMNIEVKKLITIYDFFTLDVTDALKTKDTGFRVKIGQPRLNHKQFTIKVNVASLVSQKGIMKIYLGPKLMPGELVTKKNLLTLIDTSEINLKVGSNLVTRSPDNMKYFSEDFVTLNTISKKVEYAGFGLDSLPLNAVESQVGFPARLILPRGTSQGLEFQIFVFIAPYVKTSSSSSTSYSQKNLQFNDATLSHGFPLDLAIQDRQLFGLPNSMLKYVTIMQKGDSKVENYGGPGVTKSWYKPSTYDPSSRPKYNSKKNTNFGNGKNDNIVNINEYTVDRNDIMSNEDFLRDKFDSPYNLQMGNKFDYSSKSPFDYKAKKAQFDKKDYTTRRNFTNNFDKTDYSTTRNFTKYNSAVNVDSSNVISSTTYKIVSSTEQNYYPELKDNMMIQKNAREEFIDVERLNSQEGLLIDEPINSRERVIVVEPLNTREAFLDVEPLPIPAFHKNDLDKVEKYNYTGKKIEREGLIKEKKSARKDLIKEKKIEREDKLKEKKLQLDDLIKDAKKKRYFSNREEADSNMEETLENFNDSKETNEVRDDELNHTTKRISITTSHDKIMELPVVKTDKE